MEKKVKLKLLTKFGQLLWWKILEDENDRKKTRFIFLIVFEKKLATFKLEQLGVAVS